MTDADADLCRHGAPRCPDCLHQDQAYADECDTRPERVLAFLILVTVVWVIVIAVWALT